MIEIMESLTEEQLAKRLRQDKAVIQSLGNIYFANYYINIQKDTFVEVTGTDDVHAKIGTVGTARERLAYMCRNMVQEAYTEEMLAFTDLDTVAERLEGKQFITMQYQGKVHGWSEAIFIPCNACEGKELHHVLYAVREIGEEKERELRMHHKETEQLRIIRALSKDYALLFLLDADTRKVSLYQCNLPDMVHRRVEEILALGSYERSISKYINTYLSEEDRERVAMETTFENLMQKVTSESIYKVGYSRMSRGEIRYFDLDFIKTYDENNRLVFVMGIRDITDEWKQEHLELERVQALETAQKVTQEIEAIHASLGSGNCSLDFDEAGEIIKCRWSKEIRKMLGYDGLADFPDEFDSLLLLIHKDDKKRVMNSLWAALKDYSGQRIFDAEVRIKTKTRGYRWFRSTGRILRRSDGSPFRYHGVIVDIDSGKEAQRALKEQYAIVETLSNEFQTIFLINLQDNKIRVLKAEGYIMIGMTKEDYNGQPYYAFFQRYIFERVHPDDVPMMLDAMREENIYRQIATSGEYSADYRVMEMGTTHYYQFTFVPVPGAEGLENRLILGFRNIDAIMEKEVRQKEALQVALDAARQANMAKTAFLNNMSHDIRTPMNAIIGFTELALKHRDQPELIVDYLQKIETSSQHLLSLINDVLDMSRIESGKVVLEDGPANLRSVMDEIVTMVQSDMDSRELTFKQEFVGLRNENVIVDKLRLNQVLLNLLSNAMKFTRPQGEVILKVKEAEDHPEGLGRYEFSVSDTGIGMSKDFAQHVFEPFERERSSTVTGIQGTGLGMAITKNLVEIMGGSINVRTWEGVGTTFTVILNLDITSDEAATVEGEEEIDYTTLDFTGKHILLVEDNELNREIAEDILMDAGFAVTSAGDGSVAVDRMECAYPGLYDAILMDVQMPVMNGYEATRRIRKMPDKALADIPIFAMTANAFEEDKREAFEAGMTGHIPKPIDVQVLLKELYMALK